MIFTTLDTTTLSFFRGCRVILLGRFNDDDCSMDAANANVSAEGADNDNGNEASEFMMNTIYVVCYNVVCVCLISLSHYSSTRISSSFFLR